MVLATHYWSGATDAVKYTLDKRIMEFAMDTCQRSVVLKQPIANLLVLTRSVLSYASAFDTLCHIVIANHIEAMYGNNVFIQTLV